MNDFKKEKEWQEDLKNRIKKLRERAEKKPELKKVISEEKKPISIEKSQNTDVKEKENTEVTEKNEYIEIKDEEAEIEKKPEVVVKIERENHYAIIKPIIDELKEKAKEEFYEEKIKEKDLEHEKKTEKAKEEFYEEKIKEKDLEHEKKTEKTEVPKKDIESSVVGLETKIDKLIDIINKKESVTIIELSRELDVSIDRIENWAKILEDRGVINIDYPLIGPSRLRKKEWKKES